MIGMTKRAKEIENLLACGKENLAMDLFNRFSKVKYFLGTDYLVWIAELQSKK